MRPVEKQSFEDKKSPADRPHLPGRRKAWAWAWVWVWGLVLLTAFACGEIPGERLVFSTEPDEAGDGPFDLGLLGELGLPVGSNCTKEVCRPGLVCGAKDRCEPSGKRVPGDACVMGAECEVGLSCFLGSCPIPGVELCPICQANAAGELGEPCASDLECSSGLRCGLEGLSIECLVAGSTDAGGECELQDDCFQGLYCNGGLCSPQPPNWAGVECTEDNDDNVEALFFVPGAEGTPDKSSFFSHPYPSDIRIGDNGRPNLEGFPSPGSAVLGTDLVKRYVEAIESNTNGWSTNPTVIFRFSGGVDFLSFTTPPGEPTRLNIADVDELPTDPNDGFARLGYEYATGTGSKYVCDHWLALSSSGGALKPGHTYVAWITTAVRSALGAPVRRSSQFSAMLQEEAPADDSALKKAHQAFRPLRNYLRYFQGSSNEVDPKSLLVATVFTTDDPLKSMRKLAVSVEDTRKPTASNWVKCGGGDPSPCPQADEEEGRACGTMASDKSEYQEYQALLELPIFQKGKAPYLEEGGAIQEKPVRHEKVCMSVSIPLEPPPTEGWPVVVYGHGTGGSYRSALRQSVAGRLARATPSFATLGYDEVQHGPRRGQGKGAEKDPESLFFNFLNPDAARGNPLQGAADLLSVLRFLRTGLLASASEAGDIDLQVDPSKIFLYGHSQGATHDSLALPFSDLVGGVLSGNGGGLADSLMDKTSPVNIAGAIPFAIQDPDAEGKLIMREKHPVMGLLQHYIDPADPINFAPLLILRPEPNRGPKSILQTFGLDDSYAPPSTLAGFVKSAGFILAPPPTGLNPSGENDLRYLEQAESVSGNVTLDDETVTAVCRQYDGGDTDGHFVAHSVPDATDDVVAFLSSLGRGEQPTVPAR